MKLPSSRRLFNGFQASWTPAKISFLRTASFFARGPHLSLLFRVGAIFFIIFLSGIAKAFSDHVQSSYTFHAAAGTPVLLTSPSFIELSLFRFLGGGFLGRRAFSPPRWMLPLAKLTPRSSA